MSGGSANGSKALSPRERARLAGILARLSSSFDNERAAAGLLATAFLAKHNLMWSDLAEMTQPRADAEEQPAAQERKRDRQRGGNRWWRGYCRRRQAVGRGAAVDFST